MSIRTHKYLIDKYYKSTNDKIQQNKQNDHIPAKDLAILKEHYMFLLDDEAENDDSWEMKLVQAYHSRLFKEYCLTDFRLTPPNTSKLALRWRSEKEVISSKGQFICGNIPCDVVLDLSSWQVNFQYSEAGISKNVLVKIRLCLNCSKLLPKNTKNLSAASEGEDYAHLFP